MKKTESQKLMVSVPEAASQLSIAESFLWRLIYAGKVQTVRIGRRRLISINTLTKLASEGIEGNE